MEADIQGFTLITQDGQLIPVFGSAFATDFAANPDVYNDDTTDYSIYSEPVAKLLRFRYRSSTTYLDAGDTNPVHSYAYRIELVQIINRPYRGKTDAQLAVFLTAKRDAVSDLVQWLKHQIIVRGGLIEADITRYGKTLKIGQSIAQVGELVAMLPGANLIGAGLVLISSVYTANNSDSSNALERKRQIEAAAAEIITLQGYQALADAEIKNLGVPKPGPDKWPIWLWGLIGVGGLLLLLILVKIARRRNIPAPDESKSIS